MASRGEVQLADIIIEGNFSQGSTDRLLRSDMFSRCYTSSPREYTSFRDSKSFLDTVDLLPGPRASWSLIETRITGNRVDEKGDLMTEVVYCWARNPVEVVVELLGNPNFRGVQSYAPRREYVDEPDKPTQSTDTPDERRRWVINEMSTADWWARVQEELAKRGFPDATIAPVMLASDKTQLSVLSGDKQAYPVYLTIGNIDKDVPAARHTDVLAPWMVLEEVYASLYDGYRLGLPTRMRQLVLRVPGPRDAEGAGLFKTHLVQWVSQGHEDELDARFARVPPYPGLRVFTKGISKISQWTGNEFRQMEKVFLGLVDGLHDDSRILKCARAVLDFIYLAHYPSHTVLTLEQMQDALDLFHTNKQVFLDLGTWDHFNIPKLHWVSAHYTSSIYDFGACDGLSTETSERLHIDCTKMGYRASNKRDYLKQMVVWLTRREKMRWFKSFLRWCDTSPITLHPNSPPPASSQHAAKTLSGTALPAPASEESQVMHRAAKRACRSSESTSSHRAESTSSSPTIVSTSSMSSPLSSEKSSDDRSHLQVEDLPFGDYEIARQPGLGIKTGEEIVAKALP
ncbi:uncharacterized protein BXZ73DRAFT_109501 [Epithele typhae]|uniref:uncharacterized protein n=1 Tax=Epithele typhae TaxID=378194 RepID=UPI00200802F8|nr:uncharacterized protein BXZ73DRAFT_109501 [Epithele typhae]KAH9910144.1 hypothetical protein BXZ73DRAFT_109501 [Epithele typhae]